MPSNRIGRINEEIQRELAALIRTVKDPRVHGLVSVTAVDTTPDLRYAKIYVSVLDKSDVKEVVKGLKSAGGYLRRELGRALSLRYTPELQFVEDDSIDTGAHILSMLRNPEVVKPANPANAHIGPPRPKPVKNQIRPVPSPSHLRRGRVCASLSGGFL